MKDTAIAVAAVTFAIIIVAIIVTFVCSELQELLIELDRASINSH